MPAPPCNHCDDPTATNVPWSRSAATVKGGLSGLTRCCFCESGSLYCTPKPGKHERHLRKPIPTTGAGRGSQNLKVKTPKPASLTICPRDGKTNVQSRGGDRPRAPRWETAKPQSAASSSTVPYGPPPAHGTLPGKSRSCTASLRPWSGHFKMFT